MPRCKHYSYDQKLMIPIDLRSQLQPGTFELALNRIVDELDLSTFDQHLRNNDTGAPAYDPTIVLKIVLCAYSRAITSSRQISRDCRENVVFMALATDSHPHFTTIAALVASMKDEITALFRNVLMICADEGLIGQQMFAIDGCKISSNCAKEWSATRADSGRKRAKLERSIELLLRKHRQGDEQEDPSRDPVDDQGPCSGMRQKEQRAIARLRGQEGEVRDLVCGERGQAGGRGATSSRATSSTTRAPRCPAPMGWSRATMGSRR